jgi:hypothetical protein
MQERDVTKLPVADLTEAEFTQEWQRLVDAIAIKPSESQRQAELIARKAQPQAKPQVEKPVAVAVALLLFLALLTPSTHAQGLLDRLQTPGQILGTYYSGVTWTNRLAGSTSTTNWSRIDISRCVAVAVELEAQNVTGGASNLVLYLGRSVAANISNTNAIDNFATVTLTFSGTALTTTWGHTNFSQASTGNQSLLGYSYLWLGPLTNLFAAGSSYATNVVVRVSGSQAGS